MANSETWLQMYITITYTVAVLTTALFSLSDCSASVVLVTMVGIASFSNTSLLIKIKTMVIKQS